ncbi:hypothetical protein GPECTOR_53g88 [Gonium pectorale]|uniref:Protein kinase domain-containing protein n=1 Tax=Gonium pectorale TaxID=33097 RepID=A0A150G7R9_GONPE|nr:hypothetical protein GPECTOR_53g88 [Gonium pectorale]|eukprot:KXZ45595.1 hypothetical protein GPECTOR_53g88 [Gonium pectorale]
MTHLASFVAVLFALPSTSSPLFIVPPNGTLELRGLRITGLALPTRPFPLPASTFLVPLAFRMGAGARLRLVDVSMSTPSCASLALHQSFACSLPMPSPNVSVSPSSLTLHRLTTQGLEADNATVTCTAELLPYSCLSAVVSSSRQLVEAVAAASATADLLFFTDSAARDRPPLYVFLATNVTLTAQDVCAVAATAPTATSRSGGGGSATAGPGCPLGSTAESEAVPSIAVSIVTIVAGPPNGRTVLHLGGLTSVFNITHRNRNANNRLNQGTVHLANLTLAGLPVGPPGDMPRSLLRLGLWAFAGVPRGFGSLPGVLVAQDVAVELPPEELAMWFNQAGVALPAALAPYLCVGDASPLGNLQTLVVVVPPDFAAVQAPDEPNALLLLRGAGYSSSFMLRRVLLRPAWSSAATGTSAEQANAAAAAADRDTAAAAVPGFGPYTSRGSICTLVPPMWGEAAVVAAAASIAPAVAAVLAVGPNNTVPPFSMALQKPVLHGRLLAQYLLPYDLSDANDPFLFSPQQTAANSSAAFKPVLLNQDLALLVSSSALSEPGFGQVQATITFPVMLMGEPVWRRVLDLAALPSAAVVAGRRGLLTLRHLTLINAPPAGPWQGVQRPPAPPSPPPASGPQRPYVKVDGGSDGGPSPRAARALAEAATSASLSHPNIVATYTYVLQPLWDADPWVSDPGGEGGGVLLSTPSPAASSASPYAASSASGGVGTDGMEVWKLTLVQELCDARSLRHCLQCGTLAAAAGAGAGAEDGAATPTPSAPSAPSPLPVLPAGVVLALARDVARGMAHLHSLGFVHAGLSSSNILLQSCQHASPSALCGYTAKLYDLRLSGRHGPEASTTHLSGPASSAYSAPELVRDGRAGPAGDAYAFGVVLWELALGLPLPAALTRPEGAALRAWLAEQAAAVPEEAGAVPPGVLVWPPHLPPGYPTLAAECLQEQPHRRPPFGTILIRLEGMRVEPT